MGKRRVKLAADRLVRLTEVQAPLGVAEDHVLASYLGQVDGSRLPVRLRSSSNPIFWALLQFPWVV